LYNYNCYHHHDYYIQILLYKLWSWYQSYYYRNLVKVAEWNYCLFTISPLVNYLSSESPLHWFHQWLMACFWLFWNSIELHVTYHQLLPVGFSQLCLSLTLGVDVKLLYSVIFQCLVITLYPYSDIWLPFFVQFKAKRSVKAFRNEVRN